MLVVLHYDNYYIGLLKYISYCVAFKHYFSVLFISVTTCRKAVTIILSFMFFAKPFTLQWVPDTKWQNQISCFSHTRIVLNNIWFILFKYNFSVLNSDVGAGLMCGQSKINLIGGQSKINLIGGQSKINLMGGQSKINLMGGQSKINPCQQVIVFL